MADILELVVEPRAKAGKGSARAARRSGMVPAVVYGGKKAPETICIPQNELVRLLNKGGFLSHQYDLKIGDRSERVIPRDIQLHPVKDTPMHVDFLRLSKDSRIVVEIPVHFVGEDDCPGLREGGVLNAVRTRLELEVPASAMPEFIEVDISTLELGDQIRISNVTLPEGCQSTITDRDFMIATIATPSAVRSAEDEAAEDDEDEEAVEPELTKQKGGDDEEDAD